MYDQNRIIKDIRPLTEAFIPSGIIQRDGELKRIRDDLKPILNNQEPRNIFLYGPPGSGKTCISTYICEELTSYTSSVIYCYINCWKDSTRFSILYSITDSLGSFVSRKGVPTDELLYVIKNKLKDRQCVVILDEADKMEDDKVLYDLISNKIGIILISNDESIFSRMDDRIRSRMMSTDRIEFPQYTITEIMEILEDRASLGLLPNVIKKSQFETIASKSNGDARIALGILKVVSEEAEKDDMEKITDTLIEKAIPKADKQEKTSNLGDLNQHQKLLHDIISSYGTMRPSDLYIEFMNKCEKLKLPKPTERTIRNYLETMANSNIIKSKGFGKARLYSI